MQIHLINLGCARNQVDSEIMTGRLEKAGHDFSEDPAQAEAIIINTCCFIEDAANESIDTILAAAAFKETGCCRRLIVAGCLPERYREDVRDALPEADFFLGTGAYDRIVEALAEETPGPAPCLLPDPDIVENADLLLLESTYGDRDHRPLDETLQEFEDALRTAAEEGGNVLIPSFAVGRTQDLIYRLGQLYQAGRLKQQKVFIDSPMATKVTKVYKDYTHLFNEDDPNFSEAIKEGWENWLPIMSFTQDVEESMALNNITSGAIIIAGSGMCTGGRIRHHLKYNLWREKAHILIVGFQARGTLGRLLVDGARQVRILGSDIAVKAQIHTLGGFSAHAGQSQLITWAGRFKKPRPRLYLVHGEREKMEALRTTFHQQLDWEAHLANFRETITF